jgi:hypothetical protein
MPAVRVTWLRGSAAVAAAGRLCGRAPRYAAGWFPSSAVRPSDYASTTCSAHTFTLRSLRRRRADSQLLDLVVWFGVRTQTQTAPTARSKAVGCMRAWRHWGKISRSRAVWLGRRRCGGAHTVLVLLERRTTHVEVRMRRCSSGSLHTPRPLQIIPVCRTE